MKKINLDLKSKVPIYIQIRDQLRLIIAAGEMEIGSQMPPVRDLASELLINPNTVQKAYHELERDGYIHTRRGMGTFVSERPDGTTGKIDKGIALDITREYVKRLLDLGLTAEEIRDYVSKCLT